MVHLKQIWQVLFALPLLFGLLWPACKKDEFSIAQGSSVNVTFEGRVTDEEGYPIFGATVQAGTETIKTDANGMFQLPRLRLPSRNAILRISRPGYFEFSRAYIVQDNARKTVRVQLLAKQIIHSFLASESTMTNVGSITLNFPANSVVTQNGEAYSGIVQLYARYLDPTDPELGLYMPGDLRAVDAAGEEKTLRTFGMFGVELTTPAGEVLEIASGKQVEISMSLHPALEAGAPEEIPLWHYDEEKARWIEEGVIQKQGNRYVGKVSHFSWWNCDFPYPLVMLSGKVFIGDNQHPLVNAHIWVGPADAGLGFGCGHGGTDQNGHFGGGVPKDIPLKLTVVVTEGITCKEIPVYSENIGSFSADATLPDIIVPPQQFNSISVSGRLLDCNQQPVAKGYVLLTAGGNANFIFTKPDGTFEQTLVWCNNGALEAQAFDVDQKKTSQPINLGNVSSSLNLGDIAVCESVGEFIQFKVQDTEYLFASSFYAASEPGGQVQIITDQAGPNYFGFSFTANGTPGTFPVNSLYYPNGQDSIGAFNVTTTVTQFGNVGELIIGTLQGTAQNALGQNQVISGAYQVLRDN